MFRSHGKLLGQVILFEGILSSGKWSIDDDYFRYGVPSLSKFGYYGFV